MNPGRDEARAFAETVATVLTRHAPARQDTWAPGELEAPGWPELSALLDEIGWDALSGEPELVVCAGLGALELGRRLAPFRQVDRLLGGGVIAGELVRSLGADRIAVWIQDGTPSRARVTDSAPVASAEGLEVERVVELGAGAPIEPDAWRAAVDAWTAAAVGYLAGVGEGALELTSTYVRQRRAFGTTLAGLAPVQQLLADAATLVRGVRLLAGAAPGADALAHSSVAVAQACAACQQATGAIGFTLEYSLHRYTQRARALAIWNDALLEQLVQ